MIAPEGEQCRPLANDLRRMVLDRGGDGLGAAVIEEAVSVIDDGQLVERVELHAVGLFPGQYARSRTHRPRPETRAGPVRRRGVERHAGNHDIDTLEVVYLRRMNESAPA